VTRRFRQYLYRQISVAPHDSWRLLQNWGYVKTYWTRSVPRLIRRDIFLPFNCEMRTSRWQTVWSPTFLWPAADDDFYHSLIFCRELIKNSSTTLVMLFSLGSCFSWKWSMVFRSTPFSFFQEGISLTSFCRTPVIVLYDLYAKIPGTKTEHPFLQRLFQYGYPDTDRLHISYSFSIISARILLQKIQ